MEEREIWVGKTRNYLGEDNIFYVTMDGKLDKEMAIGCREASNKLIKIAKEKGMKKFLLLIDMNKASKPSTEARKIFVKMSEKEENTMKMALFGLHAVARVLASFLMGTSKNKNMQFFKTKEDALKWLKE